MAGFVTAKALPEFLASIAKPRPILDHGQGRQPVDGVIESSCPSREGDIIIDGAIALTDRRDATKMQAKKSRFVGMGFSGGRGKAERSRVPHVPRRRSRSLGTACADADQMARPGRWVPCCTYIGPEVPGTTSRWCHGIDMPIFSSSRSLRSS